MGVEKSLTIQYLTGEKKIEEAYPRPFITPRLPLYLEDFIDAGNEVVRRIKQLAKGTYTAIAPLVQKGAHLVLISTPNGAEGNVFFHLWHGTPFSTGQAA